MNKKTFVFLILLSLTFEAHASFIESTMGAAVVNDATATYYNPAALILVSNTQLISLGSYATSRSMFTGQVTQVRTQFTLTGRSNDQSHYYLPTIYVALPLDKFRLGFALISNFFNTDLDDHSILRYVKSSNDVKNIDFITSMGFSINKYFSLGAGVNFSRASFLMEPISGFPSLNIPDSQSRNKSNAHNIGGFAGFLIRPDKLTLIGFNYRSSINFPFKGTSELNGINKLISKNYNFTFWTPARSVLSVNRAITPSFAIISTAQYIKWDIFKKININGIATQVGSRKVIVNAQVPYYLHNSWILTLGNQYKITSQWTIRLAAAYVETPANGKYQISNGDSLIIGGSMGYDINKDISIDGSYAHAFVKNAEINIVNARNTITGVNKSARDSVSLKLTLNAN